MMPEYSFDIHDCEFSQDKLSHYYTNHLAQRSWPMVYILSDDERGEAYVGETIDIATRLGTHLKNQHKKKLTAVHIISSDKFNKSAALDIESSLIEYMAGDGQYALLNGTLGLVDHSYYQKNELYQKMFEEIWESLRKRGIAKSSVKQISNSDLFKYSPYRSLRFDQRQSLISILRSLVDPNLKQIVVEGGAGTGKTILAIYLFKALCDRIENINLQDFKDDEVEVVNLVKEVQTKFPNLKMRLVVPMTSFRETLKKAFKHIPGLLANMVIGPADVTKNEFDILVVDESHRLRRRRSLGAYYGAFDNACKRLGMDEKVVNEVDWVLHQSQKAILFYDQGQSIKPSDIDSDTFDELKKSKSTKVEVLKSQLRVLGGANYVDFIDKLLRVSLSDKQTPFRSSKYECKLYSSLKEMVSDIKQRNKDYGLCRLIAGYSWKWVSKKEKEAFDIEIGDMLLRWNGTIEDWINSENAPDEVGCIHTTQGYDLNYAGVIFGEEISYNESTDTIVIDRDKYFDQNGKLAVKDPEELKAKIINIYNTVMLRGIRGTYVYACNPSLQSYLAKHIPLVEPRNQNESKIRVMEPHKVQPYVNAIPLFDLEVAAGEFGEIQQVEDMSWIQLPPGYKHSESLFACKVVGESMNKRIPNNSICLFSKETGGSRQDKIVLVEMTGIQDPDTGSCYTVKEYHSKKKEGETWEHERIILRPLSNESRYKDIELFNVDGMMLKVLGIFVSVISIEE